MAMIGGCASGAADGGATNHAATVTTDDGVTFTGAWANELKKAYEHANTDLGRSVLADGKITDAEYEEVKTAFASCVADKGFTVIFESNGGYSVKTASAADSDAAKAGMQSCENSTDYAAVQMLRNEMQGNPNHEDPAKVLVACLIRHGLADPSLTAEDYKQIVVDQDRDAQMFGKYYDSGRPDYDPDKAVEYQQCNTDPAA